MHVHMEAGSMDVVPGFTDFISDLEISFMESPYGSRLNGKNRTDPMKKLVAFADTKMFDVDGAHVEDLDAHEGRWSVAMVLRLDGLWISERSYGLKLKVVHVKLYARDPPKRIHAAAFLDDSADEKVPAAAFGFLDD